MIYSDMIHAIIIITFISVLYLIIEHQLKDLYEYYQVNLFAAAITARVYLNVKAYSRKGLIAQLLKENFTILEAQYGVDSCQADWLEQAQRYLKEYSNIDNKTPLEILTEAEFDTSDINQILKTL